MINDIDGVNQSIPGPLDNLRNYGNLSTWLSVVKCEHIVAINLLTYTYLFVQLFICFYLHIEVHLCSETQFSRMNSNNYICQSLFVCTL